MQHHGIVVYKVVGRREWPCRGSELAGRIEVYCVLAGQVLELAGRRAGEWGRDAHRGSSVFGAGGDGSVFDGVVSRDGLAPDASLGLDHILKDLEMLHDLIVSDPHAVEFELRVPHCVVVGHKVSRGVVHARGDADVFVFGVLLHAAEVGLVRAQEPAVRGGPEVAKGEGPLLDAVEAGDGGRVLEGDEVEDARAEFEEVAEGLDLVDESVDAADLLRGAELAVGEHGGLGEALVVVGEGGLAQGHDDHGLPLRGARVGRVEELGVERGLEGPEEAVSLHDRGEAVEGEDDGVGRVNERRGPLFEFLFEVGGGGHDGVDLGGVMCAEAGDSLAEAFVCFRDVLGRSHLRDGRAAETCKHIKFMHRTHMTTDNVSKKCMRRHAELHRLNANEHPLG